MLADSFTVPTPVARVPSTWVRAITSMLGQLMSTLMSKFQCFFFVIYFQQSWFQPWANGGFSDPTSIAALLLGVFTMWTRQAPLLPLLLRCSPFHCSLRACSLMRHPSNIFLLKCPRFNLVRGSGPGEDWSTIICIEVWVNSNSIPKNR